MNLSWYSSGKEYELSVNLDTIGEVAQISKESLKLVQTPFSLGHKDFETDARACEVGLESLQRIPPEGNGNERLVVSGRVDCGMNAATERRGVASVRVRPFAFVFVGTPTPLP
jgi:hypothetical protein